MQLLEIISPLLLALMARYGLAKTYRACIDWSALFPGAAYQPIIDTTSDRGHLLTVRL